MQQHIAGRLPQYYKDAEVRRQAAAEPENDWQYDMMHGSDEAKAEYRHGVLTVRIPKAKEARPRRLEVAAA